MYSIRLTCLLVLAAFSLCCRGPALAQRPDFTELFAALDRDGVATAPSGVEVRTADYAVDSRKLEALTFRPVGPGPFPALLLIPGHGTTARDWTGNALAFAEAGYASIAVSQPGYGTSAGPPDFVGPFTVSALAQGWEQLGALRFVDAQRRGIVGYSRGALAAALLAERLEGVGAVVLGGGIYDFQLAYDESVSKMIKQNMLAETGMTPEAVDARSPVRHLETLTAPVLILHGSQDINAPVSQAYALRDALSAAGKDFELQLFDSAHSIGIANFRSAAIDFLGRRLKPAEEAVVHGG
jgi:dipeptidyl aminopeptidase/acylaminoacyl peptidase